MNSVAMASVMSCALPTELWGSAEEKKNFVQIDLNSGFADVTFNAAQMEQSLFDSLEYIVGKGQNADYQLVIFPARTKFKDYHAFFLISYHCFDNV